MQTSSSDWIVKNLQTILQQRRIIIINTAIVSIIAIAVSFILPKWYSSRSTILPPESNSPLSGLLGLSTGQIAQAVTNFSLPLMSTPSDLYASMLESEKFLKDTVDKLKLQEVYDTKTPWDAVAELKDNVKISVEADGIIIVEAEAKDRQLAADIVNSLVLELDEFNREIQNQKGRDYSRFLENRLKETDSLLRVASNELKSFQETHKAIAIELQSQVLIENLAKQKAELTTAEIELQMLRNSLSADHPEVLRKSMMIREIKRKLESLESGASSRTDSTISALEIPLSDIPDLTLKFAILTRNVKIQEMTFELLSQQYEIAKIQERRDTPTVVVLDTARPADLPIRPRKKVIVIAAFMIALVGTSFYVIVKQNSQSAQSLLPPAFSTIRESLAEVRRKPLG